MRANASGPILEEDMKKKGITEYKLRSPNSYHVKTKAGKWGMIAYANEIYSVMAGWKKGRFTGGIEASARTKDNPEKFEILKDISYYYMIYLLLSVHNLNIVQILIQEKNVDFVEFLIVG